ncbi:hypothetical protein N7510_005904 [Penicillium lagena]|uniref:uncharacterized protein n=1 Tax=Penicillium lagena TaxID=94218 RepID=UPI00254166D3|nr:uncharacterized protein N7510_005904 [Penicillium lagena]KAJ5612710.1 hypothetical protein N7510_005904 [Penicillium lagena]
MESLTLGAAMMVVPEVRRQTRPQLQALNVEKKEQRFPRRDDTHGPTIATWRSNLAALSQRRNLLFVAYGCDIYVWIPTGPGQLLGAQAEMVITPVMKEPRASGYIDPSKPHTINNILVDDLGLDEVLLLATDSGNVCGYQVEAIFSAINRCAKNNYTRPYDGAEASPFFVEHVGRSAWGLATHKFARLIAVSSNTGLITVFAFALVDPTSGDDERSPHQDLELDEQEQTWVLIQTHKQLRQLQKLMPNHRSRNLRLTYSGHHDNIPCISFANFDLDPNGMWMVSTDISNRVLVWRIWDEIGPIQWYYPGDPLNEPRQMGWSVLPLDPRTFRWHHSAEEACGCEPEQLGMEGRIVLDVHKALRGIPDSSQMFLFGVSKEKHDLPELLPDDLLSADCCVNDNRRPCLSDEDLPSSPSSSQVEDESSFHASRTWPEDDQSDFRRVARVEQPFTDIFPEDNDHLRVPPFLNVDPSSDQNTNVMHDMDLLGLHAIHPHDPDFFPVMHFSQHHISLAPYPISADFQMVCQAPLSQRTFNMGISHACDRFNMIKYIPDLGLVLATSQKGRVAIISLTWQEKIGYAFRVDWIVPFATQERDDERPMLPLLGMAASPMPGFEVPPDVPIIPRDVDPTDGLRFNYRILNPGDDAEAEAEGDQSLSSSPEPPSSFTSSNPSPAPQPRQPSISNTRRPTSSPAEDTGSDAVSSSSGNSISDSDSPPPDLHHSQINIKPTLPELHAKASQAYHPRERWHGWHPSRHYRLLLLFCDHTVMSYEFWHDWNS